MNIKNIERWRPVEGFETYLVSNKGRIMNGKTGKILHPYNHNGYCRVDLFKSGKKTHKKVHRLVGSAFVPNPDNLETINHIDEVKTNNRAENLEWLSAADNLRYSRCKPVEMYDIYRGDLICTFESITACSKLMGFNSRTISKACKRADNYAYGFFWRFVA